MGSITQTQQQPVSTARQQSEPLDETFVKSISKVNNVIRDRSTSTDRSRGRSQSVKPRDQPSIVNRSRQMSVGQTMMHVKLSSELRLRHVPVRSQSQQTRISQ